MDKNRRLGVAAVTAALAVGGALSVAVPALRQEVLPPEYLGRWYFIGSGGGITGEGFGGEAGASIVITRDNEIEHYAPDGTYVSTESFRLTRGTSIYTGEEAWMLDESSGVPRVVELRPPDGLSISENVYDGFSSWYERGR